MALIKCRECGGSVSTEAKICPHCGAGIKKKTNWLGMLAIIFFIGLIANYIGTTFDSYNEEQPVFSKKHWFQDGNLHNATVGQWKSATYQNKLATAADWLAATKWSGYLKSSDDFDRLKIKAQMLVNAVDEVVTVEKIDSLQVNEIAGAIITMSNDLSP